MYFITDKDDNYTVKGSRDPLGFQVIWQEAGRLLIPNISTVSNRIKDFQILSLAFAIKDELNMDDKEFDSFFIRFEQLMAYTRYSQNPKESFNGIDKVRKTMSLAVAEVKISNESEEQILSNQRAYGIWGKYIRPFLDCGITKDPDFRELFKNKLESNSDFFNQIKALKKKTEGIAHISLNKLVLFYDMIEKPKGKERKLFIKYLLNDTCENELLSQLKTAKIQKKLGFYKILNTLLKNSNNERFKLAINKIKETEKVLSPLNHIFRYLQVRSFWKIKDLEDDQYITAWRTRPNTLYLNETSCHLSALLSHSNIDLIKGLVKQNEEICKKRKSAPWVRMTDSGLEVNHNEGAYFSKDYNPVKHSDNNYFLDSFIFLFNQLK
jgi:hypothetical protein